MYTNDYYLILESSKFLRFTEMKRPFHTVSFGAQSILLMLILMMQSTHKASKAVLEPEERPPI
jgi:hypothetical protein